MPNQHKIHPQARAVKEHLASPPPPAPSIYLAGRPLVYLFFLIFIVDIIIILILFFSKIPSATAITSTSSAFSILVEYGPSFKTRAGFEVRWTRSQAREWPGGGQRCQEDS